MTMQPKQTTRSEEVIRKHKEYLWPAVTNFYEHPLVADRGSMQYVWDVEGRRYLDFFGGILTVSVGHANPKVTGPVKAQVMMSGVTSQCSIPNHFFPVRPKPV